MTVLLLLTGCEEVVIVGGAPSQQPLQSDHPGFSWLKLLDAPKPAEGLAVARFPDDQGLAVSGWSTARDALGRPHHDIFVSVLDPDGHVVWSKTIDYAGKDDDAFDVIVTPQHEILAAGSVTGEDGSMRAWLRKWSPGGAELATTTSEPDVSLRAKALGLWEGDVIVAGYANTFEVGRDVVVERRDGNTLSTVWSARYDGPLHGEDEPNDLAIWRSGAFWAAGYQQTQIGAGTELSLLELRPDGTITWQRSLKDAQDTPLVGQANGIAFNDIDNVYYLCGSALDAAGTHGVPLVSKLGFHGDDLWHTSIPELADASSDIAARGCALGSDGLSVVGTSASNGRSQFWAVKLQPAGTQLWLRRDAALATGRGVAPADDGGAFVTGQTADGELFVGKLLP